MCVCVHMYMYMWVCGFEYGLLNNTMVSVRRSIDFDAQGIW